jgi:hypothetical protein
MRKFQPVFEGDLEPQKNNGKPLPSEFRRYWWRVLRSVRWRNPVLAADRRTACGLTLPGAEIADLGTGDS